MGEFGSFVDAQVDGVTFLRSGTGVLVFPILHSCFSFRVPHFHPLIFVRSQENQFVRALGFKASIGTCRLKGFQQFAIMPLGFEENQIASSPEMMARASSGWKRASDPTGWNTFVIEEAAAIHRIEVRT